MAVRVRVCACAGVQVCGRAGVRACVCARACARLSPVASCRLWRLIACGHAPLCTDRVSLVDGLELNLGVIARVHVGMVLARRLSVGLRRERGAYQSVVVVGVGVVVAEVVAAAVVGGGDKHVAFACDWACVVWCKRAEQHARDRVRAACTLDNIETPRHRDGVHA
eukprot:6196838-Pleurochrysis_carterae.AAC.1